MAKVDPVAHQLTQVAKRIRQARLSQGLSQVRLARQAGLSADAVVRLEKKDRSPNVETLFKLADALGVHASELLPQPSGPARDDPRFRALLWELRNAPDDVVHVVTECARSITRGFQSRRTPGHSRR